MLRRRRVLNRSFKETQSWACRGVVDILDASSGHSQIKAHLLTTVGDLHLRKVTSLGRWSNSTVSHHLLTRPVHPSSLLPLQQSYSKNHLNLQHRVDITHRWDTGYNSQIGQGMYPGCPKQGFPVRSALLKPPWSAVNSHAGSRILTERGSEVLEGLAGFLQRNFRSGSRWWR